MAVVGTAAIITEVRDMVSDTVTPYRWSDTLIRRYIYDGEMMCVKNHPESQYDTAVANTDPVLYTSADGDTTVTERWKVPLCHYVAWRLLVEDAEDVLNSKLGQTHYEWFMREMG